MSVLREELLAGRSVALAGAPDEELESRLRRLGARIEVVPRESSPESPASDTGAELEEWARDLSPLDALVFCAEDTFGGGGELGLQAALEQAWVAGRAVATGGMIGSGGTGGKLVFIAPRAESRRELLGAAAAALENLARTLSVEWARHAITATAIVPGPRTTDGEVAELVSFLVSPAGDYFSGCRFDLGSGDPSA